MTDAAAPTLLVQDELSQSDAEIESDEVSPLTPVPTPLPAAQQPEHLGKRKSGRRSLERKIEDAQKEAEEKRVRQQDLSTRYEKARLLIEEESLSVRAATAQAGISEATYRYRAKSAAKGATPIMGQIFEPFEELHIVTVILECSKRQMAVSEATLVPYILKLAESRPRTRHFKQGQISQTWWNGFYKRHPGVKKRVTRGLVKERSDRLSQELIDPFFALLQDLKKEHPEFWTQPVRMWNVDETSLHTKPQKEYVLGAGNERVTWSREVLVESVHTTAIATVSGDGDALPLEFIRKRKLPVFEDEVWMYNLMSSNTKIHHTENAYISKNVFRNWFRRWVTNARQIVRQRLNIPEDEDAGALLLFLDGAASHVDIELIHEAILHNVIIVMFPSHTTTALQPLDKETLGSFKRLYSKLLQEYIVKTPGFLSQTTQMYLAFLAWKEIRRKKDVVLASWKYTGLIPLDPAVISNSLKHRFTSYSTIQDQFNKIRELVLGCSPGGEAESISSIFQLACKISPIYQLLDDQAQKDLEGRCKTCGRKDKRAKISLQHLHDGCCLTAADIVVEVETVHAQRQLRKEFAEAKLVERNAAKESKQMALFNPMNTQWDPNHLTKAELLKALHARGLTEPNVGRAPVLSDAKPLLVKLVKATNISIDMFDHPLRKLPVEVMSLLRVDASLMCSAASDGEEEEEDDEDFVEAEEEEQASTLRSLASANSQSGYLASAQSSSIRSTPSPSSPAPCAEITGSSFGHRNTAHRSSEPQFCSSFVGVNLSQPNPFPTDIPPRESINSSHGAAYDYTFHRPLMPLPELPRQTSTNDSGGEPTRPSLHWNFP